MIECVVVGALAFAAVGLTLALDTIAARRRHRREELAAGRHHWRGDPE